jgi:hypothetical protein
VCARAHSPSKTGVKRPYGPPYRSTAATPNFTKLYLRDTAGKTRAVTLRLAGATA